MRKFWIVIRRNPDGSVVASVNHNVYSTECSAIAEAERLAKTMPNNEFLTMEANTSTIVRSPVETKRL